MATVGVDSYFELKAKTISWIINGLMTDLKGDPGKSSNSDGDAD